jgi:ribosome biogenesis GTPase
MQGRILKAISGFYYVENNNELFECKAKGVFRRNSINPVVGDFVEFDKLNNQKGNIVLVNLRKNEIIRPPISNIDMVVIVIAALNPKPSLLFIDKQIVFFESIGIKPIICINKTDLGEFKNIKDIYEKIGYVVVETSAKYDIGIQELKDILKGKMTVLLGNSGVGKSSLINKLIGHNVMEEGILSKIERGKQTTKHTELIPIDKDTYIADSPGFSMFDISNIKKDELEDFFIEFNEFKSGCRYRGCNHILEEECGVKDAVARGYIEKSRYDNYVTMKKE